MWENKSHMLKKLALISVTHICAQSQQCRQLLEWNHINVRANNSMSSPYDLCHFIADPSRSYNDIWLYMVSSWLKLNNYGFKFTAFKSVPLYQAKSFCWFIYPFLFFLIFCDVFCIVFVNSCHQDDGL